MGVEREDQFSVLGCELLQETKVCWDRARIFTVVGHEEVVETDKSRRWKG